MDINWDKREIEVQPYSKLALMYDNVMSHVNYKEWSRFINTIINKWHAPTRSMLDVSCGTGSFLNSVMRSSNIELFGFDGSHEMVQQAKKKLVTKTGMAPVWQGDMVQYKIRTPVDIIVSLYDSINYLIDQKDIEKFLTCCHQNIRNNGLLIFDICTRKNSIDHFDDYYDTGGGADYEYRRKSKFDRKLNLHYNFFKLNFRKSDMIFAENHIQKIYYIHEILQFISQSGFGIIAILDGFSFRNASEDSFRVHFVLRKV